MARGSGAYHESYQAPRGDALAEKRSSAVKTAFSGRRTAEDQARLGSIVRKADAVNASDLAPGVQAKAQERFVKEQARTAGLEDFSGLADMNVDAEMGDAIDIPGGATASKNTSAVVKLPEGQAYTDGGITYYRPKGDPFRYQYNEATGEFSVYDTNQNPVRTGVSKQSNPYLFEQFLLHAQGKPNAFTDGAGKKSSAPASETDTSTSEVPEGAIVDEFGTVLGYEQSPIEDTAGSGPDETSVDDLGEPLDSPVGAETVGSPGATMVQEALEAEPAESSLASAASPAAAFLAGRGATKTAGAAGRAVVARAQAPGARLRDQLLTEGIEETEQLKMARASGDAPREVAQEARRLEGRGVGGAAPSKKLDIVLNQLDDMISKGELTLDDLTPEQRAYFDNFSVKTAREQGLDEADQYLVATLKGKLADDAKALQVADELVDQIDDRVAQSLGTKLGLPTAPTGQQVREGTRNVFKTLTEGAAKAPGRLARGALAVLSPMPDPTDIATIALAAPVLGYQQLSRSRLFENALRGRTPDSPVLYTRDRVPSEVHRREMFDYIDQQPTEEARQTAIHQLVEGTKFVDPKILAAVINVESDRRQREGLRPVPTQAEFEAQQAAPRRGTLEAALNFERSGPKF